MTTLANRPNSALMVIDVQKGVVADAYRRDEIVATIAHLSHEARRQGVPVVWVRQNDDELVEGSEAWRIVDELDPHDDEVMIDKQFRDAFEDTALEAELQRLGVGRLYVAGSQTDFCVRSTLHGALARGYDTFLVSDAHTTEDLSPWGAPGPEGVIAHTNLYWSGQRAPGRRAGTVVAEGLDFHAPI